MGYPRKGIACTKADYEHFEEAILRHMSGKCRTLKAAYVWMIAQYYSGPETVGGEIVYSALPLDERPTFNQFYYYAGKFLKDCTGTSDMTGLKTQEKR